VACLRHGTSATRANQLAEHPSIVWVPSIPSPPAGGKLGCNPDGHRGPELCNNHYAATGAAVLETIADSMAHYGPTNWYYRSGGFVVVLPPDHMDLIHREFNRDQARAYIHEKARRSTDELIRVGRIAQPPLPYAEVEPGQPRSPLKNLEQLQFIECGAAGGRFSAVIPRWVGSLHAICRAVPNL
jgi:hypothetical protein